MKERPIIFSAEMVRAILDGRKTQTRRTKGFDRFNRQAKRWRFEGEFMAFDGGFEYAKTPNCPYGVPGDRLYVKETWRIGAWREDGRMAIDFKASPELTNTPWVTIPEDWIGANGIDGIDWFEKNWVGATDRLIALNWPEDAEGIYHWEAGHAPFPWRSPLFMPKWASRITLEVTGVRVERLQDISEEDAKAEGVEAYIDTLSPFKRAMACLTDHYFAAHYAHMWNAINARGYPWEINPWVWAVEFKVVK